MAKKCDDRPWEVKGGRPSADAIVRAYLVLLGRPPIIREEAATARDRADAPPARAAQEWRRKSA